jgi:3-hydroxyisobutyrate dehydrogenase-like beta-hydroxyacid dehydrogenase
MNIAFVGLGNMGSAMAHNLIDAGHTLAVFNRTKSRAENLRGPGVTVARTPEEAVLNAQAAITMLADDGAVEDVVFKPQGILQALPPGAAHISMSTISMQMSRRLLAAHTEKGQHYLASPVFGRPEAAAEKKLFIVVSGPPEQVQRYWGLFDAMGQKTFNAGPDPLAATLTKLAGNFLISTVIESLGEAFALIRKSGMDANMFLNIMTNSLFVAPVYRTYGGIIAGEKYQPAGFKLPLGMKDNRLLLAAAEQAAVPMPIASLVRDRFIAAMAHGLEESDWSAIAQISAKAAGL